MIFKAPAQFGKILVFSGLDLSLYTLVLFGILPGKKKL
jgi:hypothetical protein